MPSSYLIAVTAEPQPEAEVLVAIWNIAGKGNLICGFSNETFSNNLWMIPKGRRSKEEILVQLLAVPQIHSVSVVALTNPVRNEELLEVRDLFAKIGWDSTKVPDEALSLLLNSKLQGQYWYYIDYDLRESVPRKIRIKPMEEHPHLPPDWIKTTQTIKEDDPGKEYTINDFKIVSVDLKPLKGRSGRTSGSSNRKKKNGQ